jgi:oligopeptide transport system substrate-binding protein
MPPAFRNLFPYLSLAMIALAVVWAMSFGTLPKADFTFANGDQVKTIDAHRATGVPEHRVIDGLFEGLLRSMPLEVPGGPAKNLAENVPQVLVPGVAELPEISEDGKTYIYKIRDGAKWSNGRQITAHDFIFSWQRLLHPETASEYAYQLHYVVGCEAYNLAKISPGDLVEVEVYDRVRVDQPFPRATIVYGELIKISTPPELKLSGEESADKKEQLQADWNRDRVYTVKTSEGERHFSKHPAGAKSYFTGELTRCHNVLPNFEKTVGLKALDERTLQVKLNSPTPYFNELVAFYPLFPVCRECVEKYGAPEWTRPENLVNNGAFNLKLYRMRDRIRLIKSETYWNREHVKLNTVDILAVKGDTTALNMYLTGQVDWITTVPNAVIPEMKGREDFHSTPMLTVYFYRVNVNRAPLNDVRIRRALNAAINKQEICDQIMKAGQVPARSFVPPGLAGYESSLSGKYDVDEARRLLAEAGYPNGEGMPKVEILYNTNEDHATIAQVIQQQWSKLGIKCELRNLEWGTFLDTLSNTKYSVARSAWTGDYPDPNTFLDMFVTNGPNNQTNWSNAEYDKLIRDSKYVGGAERLKILTQAEQILMDELPILPIYFYVSKNMVNPKVKGFTSTLQDIHPLEMMSVEK